ncbi:UNVERIFIED_ORG: putative membrane protein [Xanthomonas phage Xoo-sp15]
MSKWVTILIHNLGIIALTGFVFYLTRNYWTLAILICLASSKKEDN